MSLPLTPMIEALGLEIKAIQKDTRSSVLELLSGIHQGNVGSDTLYSFPLSEEPNLRDDSPVKIIVSGKEVDGTIVSVRNGVLTVALVEDLGEEIPLARLVVNDSFLVERLRDKLISIENGECSFNLAIAESVLNNNARIVRESEVPDAVFALGNVLNHLQKKVVRLTTGSSLVYVWGPPGTGKTSTLAAVVHSLYLQGKSILIVSNTNIAVDTALERIGDRLSPLPEFHKAAVLRFGPIVSDTLRAKYENQVDLDKVVERHSEALVSRRNQLRAKTTEVQSDAAALEKALKEHESLNEAKLREKQIEDQRRYIHSQVQEQQLKIGKLKQLAREIQSNLDRAASMGAIRKFFLGLNEDALRRELKNNEFRIKSTKDSLQSAVTQVQQVESQLLTGKEIVAQLQVRTKNYPPELQCKRELQLYNQKLKQLAEEIGEIDTQLKAMREELLNNCRVLATTVYQSYLKEEVARQYDAVIVDEASMLALPMVVYASGLAREKVIVAGDFRQLPPIIMSKDDICEKWLKRDVFYTAGIASSVAQKACPPTLVPLEEQFRMTEDICEVINHFFYDNHLKTSHAILHRRPARQAFDGVSSGLLYVDTSEWNPWAAFRLGTYSRYNVLHALLIRNIAAKLQANGVLGEEEVNDKLGIISPYSAQCRLISQLVGEKLSVRGSLYAATVPCSCINIAVETRMTACFATVSML